MLELKALLLTQGMHGMVSQTEGLAKALKLNYKHQTVRLKPFWNLIPPKLTPISENLLTEKFVCDCKIIISCGRKSVISSAALKKRFGKDIFNIHIQDPKVSLSHFDLIISPDHDSLKGENVLNTNYCEISVCKLKDERKVLILSAIDNLVKGAAGQAIQNMNIMFNFKENLGLE